LDYYYTALTLVIEATVAAFSGTISRRLVALYSIRNTGLSCGYGFSPSRRMEGRRRNRKTPYPPTCYRRIAIFT
jgi:hypothetical protein